MKGKAIIQLFDKDGKEVYKQEHDNIITNAYQKLFNPNFPMDIVGVYNFRLSSLTPMYKKIFGGIIISILAGAGGNPILAAAMLPCICGAMHGVTPPYCACVYTGMGIAQSELKPTLKNCMIWVVIHYVLSVVVLLGWLPLIGLIK